MEEEREKQLQESINMQADALRVGPRELKVTTPRNNVGVRSADAAFEAGIDNDVDLRFFAEPDAEVIRRAQEEGLAIAVAVTDDDDEEEVYDVVAKEFDPEAIPPFYKNRRFRCYGSLICLLTIGIVIAGSLILKDSEQKTIIKTSAPSFAPSSVPTSTREAKVRAKLWGIFGSQVDDEDNTPYSQAMDFIVNVDNMQLDDFSPNLVQRFVLALFYFKTSEKAPWASCNPPVLELNETSECPLYDFTRGNTTDTTFDTSWIYSGKNSSRWLSDEHECNWAFIECLGEKRNRKVKRKDRKVIAIDIIGQNLTGTIPEELMHIEYLLWLTLTSNFLTGTIPSVWGTSLKDLVFFEASANTLTGQIPPGFFGRQKVLQYSLPFNEFTGTIPTEIGQMTLMNSLFLYNTLIEGPLPTEIGGLEKVQKLHMYDNLFNGTLPTEIGQLAKLRELLLTANSISGSIPTEIKYMKQMRWLQLTGNDITGTIPEELFTLSKLQYLDLSRNQINGTISRFFKDLTKIQGIKLNDNKLTGTVPGQLSQNTLLDLLWLHKNDLTGTIKPSICKLIQNYRLRFLSTDCNGGGIECFCCTACCDSRGICQLTGVL